MKKSLFIATLLVVFSFSAHAQFDLQTRWTFQKGTQHPTVQLNFSNADKFGETYIRTIFDLNSRDNINIIESPSVAFLNFERDLIFWNKVDVLNRFSLHLGYQGGLSTNFDLMNAFAAGIRFKILDEEKSKLDIKVMYRYAINSTQKVPMQFSSRFRFDDPFNVSGLRFEGYADFLWQDHIVTTYPTMELMTHPRISHIMMNVAPQVWYNVGQFINAKQLHVGGELNLSLDYGQIFGLYVLPSAGIKWEF